MTYVKSPNIFAVKNTLREMSGKMLEKGLTTPRATYFVHDNTKDSLLLEWGSYSDRTDKTVVFSEDTLDMCVQKAWAYINAIPSKDELAKQAFIEALAKAIELGKAATIHDDTLAPLFAALKTMSENKITHVKTVETA